MAIPWITALKLVPWGDVIKAAPQVIEAAKGLVSKKEAQQAQAEAASAASKADHLPAATTQELALRQLKALESRVELMEQSQRQSLEIIEKLAEQNAQLVTTVSALRVGAQRLAWACALLGAGLIGVVIYLVAT